MSNLKSPLKFMGEHDLAAELRPYGKRIPHAIELATFCHEGQFRGPRMGVENDTYIHHPLRVACRLVRWGITDEDFLLSAILHDTVEDAPHRVIGGGGTSESQSTSAAIRSLALSRIKVTFGSKVSTAVGLLSNPVTSNKSQPRAVKNRVYRDHVLHSVSMSPIALATKASDLVDNAGSLKYMVSRNPERAFRSSEKYRPIVEQIPHIALRDEGLSAESRQAMADSVRGIQLP